MTGSSEHDRRSSGLVWLLGGLTLVLCAWPIVERMDSPYPKNYHGELTAWFALMAENTVEAGFIETRFMPVINPNPATFPNFRFYITHPVMDNVIRAVLVKGFGPAEWVNRLQGLGGCLIAAFFFLLISRRYFGPTGVIVGLAAFMALPAVPALSLLSMQHPVTLAASMVGIFYFLRFRERGRRIDLIVMLTAFFLAMQTDWPGYFAPALVWLSLFFTRKADALFVRDRRLVLGLPLLAAAAAALFWGHVDLLVGKPGDLWTALSRASAADAEKDGLFTWAGLKMAFGHQVSMFTIVGVAMVVAALSQLLFNPACRRWRGPMIFAFLWGLLNLVAFPTKAPYHDFWGAYWIPLVAASFGLAAEVLEQSLKGHSKIPAGPFIAIGAVALFSWVGWTRDHDENAYAVGRYHRILANTISANVPPEDRWVFVSNYAKYDAMILSVYVRANLLVDEDIQADSLEAKVRGVLRDHYGHVRGKRVLFFISPLLEDSSEARARDAALRTRLFRIGALYRGSETIIDITDWVWKG